MNVPSLVTIMNKCSLFQRLRNGLPRFHEKIALYSMLDKPPTISVPIDPPVIEDKPFTSDPTQNGSKVMKVYLDNVTKYNEFMAVQRADFEIGKRHLANMMGRDPATFTQQDINESIEYLFPCGLFEKKARPFMKPPEDVFPPKKEAEFDVTGRPFHFLFYTVTPNFYQILHDCVKVMKELDDLEDRVLSGEIVPSEDSKINLLASGWITKEQLKVICCEPLQDHQYEIFCQTMDRLSEHKYAKRAEEFILKYRVFMKTTLSCIDTLEPELLEDGRQRIRVEWNTKKSARANVTVTYPGTGKLDIDGKNIEFFKNMRAREQVLFPLFLTQMINKVDVEATLEVNSGELASAGAIRWGISRCLSVFVDADMKEKMKLAGLLQRELRRKERKKPGQEGARRQFTWRKR